ncbi:hypothetical protein CONPUDRAFT_25150, partial [Coniophora puteana RWD-64-598 SS2]
LHKEELPARFKLTELIIEHFDAEYSNLASEIKATAGRISFTSDLWSLPTFLPFMAITAHYLFFTRNG